MAFSGDVGGGDRIQNMTFFVQFLCHTLDLKNHEITYRIISNEAINNQDKKQIQKIIKFKLKDLP